MRPKLSLVEETRRQEMPLTQWVERKRGSEEGEVTWINLSSRPQSKDNRQCPYRQKKWLLAGCYSRLVATCSYKGPAARRDRHRKAGSIFMF